MLRGLRVISHVPPATRVACLCVVLCACAHSCVSAPHGDAGFSSVRFDDAAFARYLERYRIELPAGGSAYHDRVGPCGDIAVFVYSPAVPGKTVVCAHGYITHSGMNAYLIAYLLSRGCRVVCADLPGHGLSAGARCDIGDFADYGAFVAELVAYCEARWPGEIDYVGHSTGCSAAIEYVRQGGTGIAKMAFINPLVRSYLWDLSQVGMSVTSRFSDEFPSIRSDFTDDAAFNSIMKNDPLRNASFPYHWVHELEEWNERLALDASAYAIPVLVLQGAKDTVVDASYGDAYFRRAFANLRYETVEGGVHNMQCDIPEFRSRVFAMIGEFLGDYTKNFEAQEN